MNAPYNAPPGFDWVVRLESWRLDRHTLRVVGQTAAGARVNLSFQAISADIWRITFAPSDVISDPTPIIGGTFDVPIALTVEEDEQGIKAFGAHLTLHIDRDSWAIQLLDANGCDVFRENPSDIDGLGRLFVLPLGYVKADGNVTQVTASFHLRQDEHLFGLGEKFTPLDKTRQRIVSWTQDAFGSTGERSHKNIPFLMSTRGYGLFLDTGARVTWELGTVSSQSYTIMTDAPSLEAYVIYGPQPAEILERYTALTGRAPVPPKWSFGLWLSGTGAYRDQAAIAKLAEGAEEHELPVDVIHVDTWWMKWRTYCDFRWDRVAYPTVEAFVAWLKEHQLKLTLWEQPYISIESDLFEIGKREGYFAKRPDGEVYVIDYGLSLAPRPDGVVRLATPETSWNARVAIIDMTNPAAYAWYQDLHRPVFQMGVAAFKTDFGEDVPADAVFHNGQTGATMHNLFPLLYNRAVFEVTQQEKGYGLVWSRSGTAGNQRYPVCWSADPAADFDSLACTMRGGLSIGLSGVPFWSSDIGGYRGLPSPRLYVRWAQFGLFSSHSRMHGDSPREPWYFGDEALKIVKKYTALRYQLFPYLYSTAHEAHRTGMPVIRAMPLAFPDDPNTYDKDLQYMLGSELLIAPVYDASDRRRVYLPATPEGWIDFWTGQPYVGGQNIWVDAPLDTLPIFAREGAILPMMPPTRRIPESTIDPLIVEVYPGTGRYRFYEDEGVTDFSVERQDNTLVFAWNSETSRTLIIRFRGFGSPDSVQIEIDGTPARPVDRWTVLDDGTLEVRVERNAKGWAWVK